MSTKLSRRTALTALATSAAATAAGGASPAIAEPDPIFASIERLDSPPWRGAVGAAGTVAGGQRTAASGGPEPNQRIFFQGSVGCFLSGSLSGMFLIAAW